MPAIGAALSGLRARVESIETARSAEPDYVTRSEADRFARSEALAGVRSAIEERTGALRDRLAALDGQVEAVRENLAGSRRRAARAG